MKENNLIFRITHNQTSIAVVERNSQSAHIFDKHNKKQTDEIENLLRTKGVFRLWNVLVSVFFCCSSSHEQFK